MSHSATEHRLSAAAESQYRGSFWTDFGHIRDAFLQRYPAPSIWSLLENWATSAYLDATLICTHFVSEDERIDQLATLGTILATAPSLKEYNCKAIGDLIDKLHERTEVDVIEAVKTGVQWALEENIGNAAINSERADHTVLELLE